MKGRIDRAIEADARLREIAKKSENWPDPKARKKTAARYVLGPIYWPNPATSHFGKTVPEKEGENAA